MRIPSISRLSLLQHAKIAARILAIVVFGALGVLAVKWPFTRTATIQSLERVSLTDVRIEEFHKTFFPRPGYVASNVTFVRDSSGRTPPLAKIRKATCHTSWFMLISFTHRINRMELEGLQVFIPRRIPAPVRKHPDATIATTVTELIANGTVLEIAARHEGGQMTRFDFPQLAVENLEKKKAVTFRADVRNPNPPGDMQISGSVGPLALGKPAETPISGSFQLTHADLSSYKVIAGDLSAGGRFQGKLGRAQIAGHADVPNFEVTSSRHSLGLSVDYRAVVDGVHGDVIIQSADASFLRTRLSALGSITGEQEKTVLLDFDARQAEVEDLLRLFVTADRPPLEGPIAFRAHVVLPPVHRPFIKKVQLDGEFTITGAKFTSSKTQEKLAELSARAQRDKRHNRASGPQQITEELKGDVALRDAIATIPIALFDVPGAVARGSGTYNLLNEAIDLRGDLAMDASLSKAAGGVKSILLMPLDPFFRKNGAGTILRTHIGGTYPHPVIRVSLRR